MIGTFVGSILLARYSSRRFLVVNMIAALFVFTIFMISSDGMIILISLFGVGLFCANVFPIVFSMAIQSEPSKANEISALMIMGVAGGAILPLFMGLLRMLVINYSACSFLYSLWCIYLCIIENEMII